MSSDTMRVDSEDLQFVMKDTGGPIVHINARGWMELHDLENLQIFVSEAINRRRPRMETPAAAYDEMGPMLERRAVEMRSV